ncbi:AAA family ATPase, partial [Erysipelatoclostridium ramosum]|nr:AAA family ATPase [Thomasclavelia ramosa]
ILTGSAVPVDNSRMHTGTGRIARVKMYPMSLYESKESNGNISLEALFNGITDINGISSFMRVEDIAYVICR